MRQILDVMMIFSVTTIMFLLSFFESKFSFPGKKFILLCTVFLISLIIGFKVIGLDHQNYKEMYIDTPVIPLDGYFFRNMFDFTLEPVFVAIISVLKGRGFGSNVFFLISALIPLYLVYLVIIKKEKKVPITVFFFFLSLRVFAGPVDTVRHFFAAAIYLYAIYLLSEKKQVKFYLASFISVLAHYSNIVVLLIRPFLNIRWSKIRYVFTMIFVGLIALLIKNPLIDLILSLNYDYPIYWKLKYYLLYSSDEMEFKNNFHVILWSLFTYLIVLFAIIINIIALNYIKRIKEDRFHYLLLNSQIIGTIMVVFFTSFNAHNFGLRMNFLLGMGIFFIVKELLVNQVKNKKIFLFFVITFIVVYNFVILMYFVGVYSPNSRFSLV